MSHPWRLFGLVLAFVLVACSPAVGFDPAKPHHADGGFRNLPGAPERDFPASVFLDFVARRLLARQEPVPLPEGHVLSEDDAVAGVAALGQGDGVTWLGHACFLVRLGGLTILTDPFLTEWASPIVGIGPKRFAGPGISIERLPPIDLIVVSHNHYDHFDLRTIERLPGRERIAAFVPLGLGRYFRDRGYGRVIEADWGDRAQFGAVTATLVPVNHWSRRTPLDTNRTLWGGHVLEGPGGVKLFHAGDTGYGPVFREVIARHGPFDLAMVPIGGYDPPIMMKATHLDPEQAVLVADEIGARIAVGMHWGTLPLTDEPPFEPPERFRAAARAAGWPEGRARVLRIGETLALPKADGGRRP